MAVASSGKMSGIHPLGSAVLAAATFWYCPSCSSENGPTHADAAVTASATRRSLAIGFTSRPISGPPNTRISGGAPICRRRPLHPVVLRPLGPWPYVVCSIVLQTRHMGPARSLLFIPEEGGVARRLQALARAVTPQSHCSCHWRTIPSHLHSHAPVECCGAARFLGFFTAGPVLTHAPPSFERIGAAQPLLPLQAP